MVQKIVIGKIIITHAIIGLVLIVGLTYHVMRMENTNVCFAKKI
jgi:hypothetical protein